MFKTHNAEAIRAATESRAATLASVETGTHMLAAAFRQLIAADAKLTRMAPELAPQLLDDMEEVGKFVAELIDQYLPPGRRRPPRNGVRPLPARVASARTIENSVGDT
ncbi:MAG: hypothetical protein WCK65_00895 [Rhodospirillaceae bacterium]